MPRRTIATVLTGRPCSVPGCTRTDWSGTGYPRGCGAGLCAAHYRRAMRGSVNTGAVRKYERSGRYVGRWARLHAGDGRTPRRRARGESGGGREP